MTGPHIIGRMLRIALALLLLTACGPVREAVTPTALPEGGSTATPSPAPSPTATRTVEQALYPYTIAGLRAHEYQSGEIKIQAPVEETSVFTRYIIEYESDGLRITGVMQIPKQGKEPLPVLILNHGYFYRGAYRPGDGTDRAAEYFNRRGYLTLSSDYRTWAGSDIGPSLFYSGLVIDVVNLVRAVDSVPEADPARIGMLGHSMGGGVTMKVLTIEPRVKAAVLYSPVSADDADLIARWGPGCIGDVFVSELLIGCNSSDIVPADLPADLLDAYQRAAFDVDMLEQTSAINNLQYVVAPIQIGYGTEDGAEIGGTPPAWSIKLHEALLEAGKQSENFAYEGEGHSFLADQWFFFMERSAKFFDEYVRGAG